MCCELSWSFSTTVHFCQAYIIVLYDCTTNTFTVHQLVVVIVVKLIVKKLLFLRCSLYSIFPTFHTSPTLPPRVLQPIILSTIPNDYDSNEPGWFNQLKAQLDSVDWHKKLSMVADVLMLFYVFFFLYIYFSSPLAQYFAWRLRFSDPNEIKQKKIQRQSP